MQLALISDSFLDGIGHVRGPDFLAPGVWSTFWGSVFLFGQVLPCPLQEKVDEDVCTGLRLLLARTTVFHHFFAAVL